MIKAIRNIDKPQSVYINYANSLKKSNFSGDIDLSYPTRLLCSTDNSVYYAMPNLVIFPKNANDISIALKVARNDSRFKKITFTPRGGGTGTNGQSLNYGVCVDTSKYFKKVYDLNTNTNEIWAEAGVIKDELNQMLKGHNLFFSPELSTSSRACIGGMISNDAAGQGSLVYGRTSDHIKAMQVVLFDGSICTLEPVSFDDLPKLCEKNDTIAQIYQSCYQLLLSSYQRVKEVFPKLNRFLTGYDLAHAFDFENKTINLARLFCGAEGTLGFICSAKLDLTPLPKYKQLVLIEYKNFINALSHANVLIKSGAFSVETVDSTVLSLAKNDVIWHDIHDYISPDSSKILGLNIVEFNTNDKLKLDNDINRLVDYLKAAIANDDNTQGIIGFCHVQTQDGIKAIYNMRKKAVGLLAKMASDKKLVAFVEDTAVPPENLADYIKEFRALLDSLNVAYGMFGHVDTGVMHVRPALDLTLQEDKEKFEIISNSVVQLVKKYNGQMWGEHGRGYRSIYGEVFFKDLYPIARKIKLIFDKDNIFNPGKIASPYGSNDVLVKLMAPMKADIDKQIPKSIRDSFLGALSCNGNGQCFSYDKSALMCPCYRYTKNRVRSPKGYSALMRQWLYMQNELGNDAKATEASLLLKSQGPISYIKRLYNSLFSKVDFNHEYKEAIKTCLSCKSCKTQCPAGVNVAELNSRFLFMYYGKYTRPLMDLIALNAESLIAKMAQYPRFFNAIAQMRLNQYILKNIFKLVDLPLFSAHSLKELARCKHIDLVDTKRAINGGYQTIIVADPFTAAYESEQLVNFALLIKKLGQSVAILKPYANGKVRVVRGDRRGFIKTALKQSARLEQISNHNITLVGFDPALSICYADEYKELLKDMRGNFEVLLAENYLQQLLKKPEVKRIIEQKHFSNNFDQTYYLFTHCTQKAFFANSTKAWIEILDLFGIKAIGLNLSCCGMAGIFGHMKDNIEQSYSVYEQNWALKIREYGVKNCLVTGFSCRSQVHRMEKQEANHPINVIYELMCK